MLSNIANGKSSEEALRKRGMVNQRDINIFSGKSKEELYHMIDSDVASERTCAVRILAQHCRYDSDFIRDLLDRLSKEKSLYTRIEICTALEQGGIEAARLMVKYLGVIGNNQYKELPERSSKKVSYPLPRDIIARTLSKMPPTAFEVLFEALKADKPEIVSEAIDAIGYMVFYNRQLATAEHAACIYELIERYKYNKLVLWKAVMCLSAFPLKRSTLVLKEIKCEYPDSILSEEADRSLKLIKK